MLVIVSNSLRNSMKRLRSARRQRRNANRCAANCLNTSMSMVSFPIFP
jgi:hypothetical protein